MSTDQHSEETLAAALQAIPGVALQLVVPFDHSGVFHLVQLPGLRCLLRGLQKELGAQPEKESNPAGVFPRIVNSARI